MHHNSVRQNKKFMLIYSLLNVSGYGAETPTSEPGLCAIDMWDSDWDEDPEDFYIYRHQVTLPTSIYSFQLSPGKIKDS